MPIYANLSQRKIFCGYGRFKQNCWNALGEPHSEYEKWMLGD